MIEKIFMKKIWFWQEEREKHKKTQNLKFLENQTHSFRKFLREKHKEDTKLRIFINQKGTKNMQKSKIKRKTKACNWHQT